MLVKIHCAFGILLLAVFALSASANVGNAVPPRSGADSARMEGACRPKKVPADGSGHPRLFLVPPFLGDLRTRCEDGDLQRSLASWRMAVRKELGRPLPPEPDWLPKMQPDHNREFARCFRTIRPPTRLMQIAALVYALGGDEDAGAEARRRVLYYFGWNPKGPTNTFHNDEPAMSIMRNGVRAYDWTYALYSSEERSAIEACIVERSRQIYDLLKKQRFHVNPRNSHLGRQIGFLAEACCALLPEHPEMQAWYDYVVDVYRRVYPAWGCEDGGWNEGPHYWTAYMDFGLDSLTAVKLAKGEDIVSSKPFFRQTPWYFIYQCPPGSPISPFGDGWQAGPQRSTAIRSFAVLQNDPELLWFAEKYGVAGVGGVRDLVLDPKISGLRSRSPENLPQTRVFPGEGLVMSHSCLTNAASNVAFYFRSSPYGSVSHGHQDQNAFCLTAHGEPLAIASGYYDYYGSPHHDGWMRQTKAVCAITYDGGKGQPRGTNSVGRIVHFREKNGVQIFTGDASSAYGRAFRRARRDVVRLGADVFVLRDDLQAPEPHVFEYNLHALDEMAINASARKVTVSRPKAVLDIFFPGTTALKFFQTNKFDPPVEEKVLRQGLPHSDQWHLRAATESTCAAEIISVLATRRPQDRSPLADLRQIAMEKGTVLEVCLADGSRWKIVFPKDDTPPVVESGP